jgi:predicted ferric reductase
LVTALLLPGFVFLANTGDLTFYFREPAPPGQFPYVLSRVFALYALTLVWLQILLGALRPELERSFGYRQLVRLHTLLGVTTLGLLVGHALLYLTGVAMRSGAFPYAALVPDFTAHYYPRRLALGASALYLALLGALSAALRRRPWMKGVWRKLHTVNYAVFALGAWHGLSIGSDTRLEPLQALCIFFIATILLAALWRVSGVRTATSSASAR